MKPLLQLYYMTEASTTTPSIKQLQLHFGLVITISSSGILVHLVYDYLYSGHADVTTAAAGTLLGNELCSW